LPTKSVRKIYQVSTKLLHNYILCLTLCLKRYNMSVSYIVTYAGKYNN